ncbi:hypothetical protein, partial [Acetobacter malorum]|uniref:hypothetical protein n=1 Tax=Acetobacter malorum TaxID=178901 RepID=UPI001E3FA46B
FRQNVRNPRRALMFDGEALFVMIRHLLYSQQRSISPISPKPWPTPESDISEKQPAPDKRRFSAMNQDFGSSSQD